MNKPTWIDKHSAHPTLLHWSWHPLEGLLQHGIWCRGKRLAAILHDNSVTLFHADDYRTAFAEAVVWNAHIAKWIKARGYKDTWSIIHRPRSLTRRQITYALKSIDKHHPWSAAEELLWSSQPFHPASHLPRVYDAIKDWSTASIYDGIDETVPDWWKRGHQGTWTRIDGAVLANVDFAPIALPDASTIPITQRLAPYRQASHLIETILKSWPKVHTSQPSDPRLPYHRYDEAHPLSYPLRAKACLQRAEEYMRLEQARLEPIDDNHLQEIPF